MTEKLPSDLLCHIIKQLNQWEGKNGPLREHNLKQVLSEIRGLNDSAANGDSTDTGNKEEVDSAGVEQEGTGSEIEVPCYSDFIAAAYNALLAVSEVTITTAPDQKRANSIKNKSLYLISRSLTCMVDYFDDLHKDEDE